MAKDTGRPCKIPPPDGNPLISVTRSSPTFPALRNSRGGEGMVPRKRPASGRAQFHLRERRLHAPAAHLNGVRTFARCSCKRRFVCAHSPALSAARLQTPHGPLVVQGPGAPCSNIYNFKFYNKVARKCHKVALLLKDLFWPPLCLCV